MSADRTSAPLAVPEGGWQDDWLVRRADGVVMHRRDGRWYSTASGISVTDENIDLWIEDGDAFPLAGPLDLPVAPRPEPVVAPLPTEAVGEVLTRHPRPWRVETAHVDTESGDGGDPFIQDANGEVVGAAMLDDGTDYDVIDLVADAANRLVPEDDEPAVIAVEVDQCLNRPTFVRIERQGAPLVIGYVHPQPPPEDDEDAVRVAPSDIADAIVEGCTHGADHPEVDAFAPCGRCLAAALIARDYR